MWPTSSWNISLPLSSPLPPPPTATQNTQLAANFAPLCAAGGSIVASSPCAKRTDVSTESNIQQEFDLLIKEKEKTQTSIRRGKINDQRDTPSSCERRFCFPVEFSSGFDRDTECGGLARTQVTRCVREVFKMSSPVGPGHPVSRRSQRAPPPRLVNSRRDPRAIYTPWPRVSACFLHVVHRQRPGPPRAHVGINRCWFMTPRRNRGHRTSIPMQFR